MEAEMPRPNPLRSLQSEANLARRIAHERESRGWTYDGTAKRLTDAGCAIQGSAIYKIEKANPPRRISVDELVAFGKVFDLEVDELLVPINVLLSKDAARLFGQWTEARAELGRWTEREASIWDDLRDHVAKHPQTLPNMEAAVRAYAALNGWQEDEATEYWVLKLRGVPSNSPEYLAHIEGYREKG